MLPIFEDWSITSKAFFFPACAVSSAPGAPVLRYGIGRGKKGEGKREGKGRKGKGGEGKVCVCTWGVRVRVRYERAGRQAGGQAGRHK